MTVKARTAVIGTLAVLAGAALLVQLRPFEDPEEKNERLTSYRCERQYPKVELRADMGRKRRVDIEYKTPSGPPKTERVNSYTWTGVLQSFECPGTVRLTVKHADAFGGDTRCWIVVDGVVVIDRNTRNREVCSVTAHLVK